MNSKNLLVFTQKNCPNCPAMKEIVFEVGKKLEIPIKTIDISDNIPENIELELLLNQIYISSTPSVILVNEDGSMSELVLGEIVHNEELARRILNKE